MSGSRVGRVARRLRPLLLGRPLHGPERYRPFFIVGSGRCGTTLLRAMLEAHPLVHIPPENALGDVVRDYRRYSRLPWNVLLRVVLGRLEFHSTWDRWELPLGPVFRDLEGLPDGARNLATILDALYRAHAALHKPAATRWGDKTPPHATVLPALRAVFPDALVIHMLRDGRDVVRSFMDVSRQSLAYHAGVWLRSIRQARAFGARHPSQYVELRYEDLVREPGPTIQRVTGFLNLAFDERMLRHHELELRLSDVKRYRALQGALEPVHQRSIGRWRDFTAAQQAELEQALGPTLASLGYLDAAVSVATPTGRGR